MTAKEKREALIEYEQIVWKIETIDERIRSLRESATGTQVITGGEKGGFRDGNKMERFTENVEKLEKELWRERTKLVSTEKRVMKAIARLSNVRERNVLYLRYIVLPIENSKQKRWERKRVTLDAVAERMNYETDTVQRIHSAAIKNLNLRKSIRTNPGGLHVS